jgi:hypothetical protein
MNYHTLITGYKKLMNNIYSPRNYYQRLLNFLKQYEPRRKKSFRIDSNQFLAFLKSIWILGIKEKERIYYWNTLFWCLLKKPKLFPVVLEMMIKGFHLRKISEEYSSI